MELNPNHPAAMGVHDHWHKICALMMLKLGLTTMTISREEVERPKQCAVNCGAFATMCFNDESIAYTTQTRGGAHKFIVYMEAMK